MRTWRAFPQALTIAVLPVACGSSSPSAPSTSPTGPPPPTMYTIRGRIVGTATADPIAGATVEFGTKSAVTDADGAFSISHESGAQRVTVVGDGLITRITRVSVFDREVAIDVIQEKPPFDLEFFRQIARNAAETEGELEPLRPLRAAPWIHIRTVDTAGDPVPAQLLDMLQTILLEWAPIWSAGRRPITTVTRGPETREGVAGWVTVLWPTEPEPGFCGRATIGSNTGRIQLYYRNARCICSGQAISPRTVRHELGHVYGYWHTNTRGHVMSNQWDRRDCEARESALEVEHAKYM